MKIFRLHLLLLATLALGVFNLTAADLATAKVVSVSGTVTKYTLDGEGTPLAKGAILREGDSITVTALSEASLVFSNGSTLTVEENTSLTLKELTQEAFGGDKSYEALQADPSKSQTLLDLNYGSLEGHVKQLQTGSTFDIVTPLGTAAIRGTRYRIMIKFNKERGEYTLQVKNKDGNVTMISKFSGVVDFSSGTAEKGYDGSLDTPTSAKIPVGRSINVRISRNDPYFDEVFDLITSLIPEEDRPDPADDDEIILKIVTPGNGDIGIVSDDQPL